MIMNGKRIYNPKYTEVFFLLFISAVPPTTLVVFNAKIKW